MDDSAVREQQQRVEAARQSLSQDIKNLGQAGGAMVKRGEKIMHAALPIAAVIGVFGLIVLGSRLLARRPVPMYRPVRTRSFLSEALRNAALSAVGALAARLARRVLLPEPSESEEQVRVR
jgi:hypothetical protein